MVFIEFPIQGIDTDILPDTIQRFFVSYNMIIERSLPIEIVYLELLWNGFFYTVLYDLKILDNSP